MDRRGFIGSILALGAAPALVKYGNIMPIFKRAENGLVLPDDEIATKVGDSTRILTSGLTLGDVFTIQGYYAFDRGTRRKARALQQFVVTGLDASGVSISPCIEVRA